ncbi:MAG TPA: MFS transporter, partial [Pyrinomonadaceae bacterium]|nr:MFS transporter [Pyrinomonadaceae bacterium]
MSNSRSAAWYAMAVLFAINTLNFFDRTIIAAVGEPVRLEFGLDDKSLGVLSTAFTLLYAVVGIPFGRFADKFSRTKLLGIGVFLWSLFTALSGLVGSYRQLFLLRLGVGIGEATCSPTATSMIADMFPSEKRARAVSIFMLGLPIGIALSFALSGTIAKEYGWRMAFIAAGVPGIFAAIAALFIREPIRGNADVRSANEARPSGSIYRRILADPTMRWLIVSGIIHNFCMYALSAFLTPLLMRYHGLDIKDANLYAMVINGLMTLPGLLLAGVVGDHAKSRRKNGALLVLTAAVFFSAPFF